MMRSMNKNVKETFSLFETLYEEGSDFSAFKIFTGYVDLDNQISGLHRGDLVAIVGDAGVGKTAFLSNIALNVAAHSNQKVLFYSLQYPAVQLVLRLICIKGWVSHHEIIRGYVENESWHKMTSAAADLLNAPLLIEDSALELDHDMLRKMRLRQEKLPDLKLIIIDSIDMLAGGHIAQYSECLRKLKAAALDMRIPILFSDFIRKEHKKKIWDNCLLSGETTSHRKLCQYHNAYCPLKLRHSCS